MLHVMRANLREPADPLPQVHPGKWYPPVETWALREGHLGKLERTSGRPLANQRFLSQSYNWFSLFE